jgi:hypothetical protein
MKVYLFSQSNPGGFYIGPQTVFVQALTADAANKRFAKSKVGYFDGARKRRDCACCGNRWNRVQEYESYTITVNSIVDSEGDAPWASGEAVLIPYNGQVINLASFDELIDFRNCYVGD